MHSAEQLCGIDVCSAVWRARVCWCIHCACARACSRHTLRRGVRRARGDVESLRTDLQVASRELCSQIAAASTTALAAWRVCVALERLRRPSCACGRRRRCAARRRPNWSQSRCGCRRRRASATGRQLPHRRSSSWSTTTNALSLSGTGASLGSTWRAPTCICTTSVTASALSSRACCGNVVRGNEAASLVHAATVAIVDRQREQRRASVGVKICGEIVLLAHFLIRSFARFDFGEPWTLRDLPKACTASKTRCTAHKRLSYLTSSSANAAHDERTCAPLCRTCWRRPPARRLTSW